MDNKCRLNHKHVRPCGVSNPPMDDYCACGCSADDVFCHVEDGSIWKNKKNGLDYYVVHGLVHDATNNSNAEMVLYERDHKEYTTRYVRELNEFLEKFTEIKRPE